MQSMLGMLQNDREKTKLPMEKLGVSRKTPTNSNLSGGFVSRWVLLQSSAAHCSTDSFFEPDTSEDWQKGFCYQILHCGFIPPHHLCSECPDF